MDPAVVVSWAPYCGVAPSPDGWFGRWNADPWVMIGLALLLAGLWLRRRDAAEGACAVAAVAVLAVAFVSPLCALASALFSARTVHHVLLVAVAAPLIAMALPVSVRPRLLAATMLQAAVFWGWHAPAAYGAALSDDAVYWLMQASLLGSAVWFWRAVRGAPAPAAVAALVAAMVLMGLLGALLTFAGQPLYAPHFATTLPWGLTPLEDQQAAGLIMWAPAAALYLAAALWLGGRLLAPSAPEAPAS